MEKDDPDKKGLQSPEEVSLDDIKKELAAADAAPSDDIAVNDDTKNDTENVSQDTEQPVATFEPLDTSGIVVGKKPRNKFAIALVILLIVALGAGAWLYFKKTSGTTTNTNPNTQTTTPKPAEVGPVSVVFTNDSSTGQMGSGGQVSVYWKPTDGGDRVKALDVPKGMYVTHYAVRGMQVAFVMEPGSGSTEGLSIWYSSDGGKAYKKVFSDKAPSSTQAMGSQITSLVFSSDAKSLVYGYLPSLTSGDGNTVTELPLDGQYKTKALFSEKKAGVFLQGYNSETQQAIYYTGCYNCDGNQLTDLMVYDGKTKTTKTLLKTTTPAMVVVKEDGTELIAANGMPNPTDEPGLEKGAQVAPFTLQKVQLSDGKATTLATLQDVVSGIGYTIKGDVYYNAGPKVVRVDKTPVTIFEGQRDILNTFYVDANTVISSVGDYEAFVLNKFNIKDQKNTTLLDDKNKSNVFGVTWQ